MSKEDQAVARQAPVVAEFRANDGSVGGEFADIPLLLLHTTGARTGKGRVTPLAYLVDGDRFVVPAANAGNSANPAWYHNLVAHPDVTIELGGTSMRATARIATGDERSTLYHRFVLVHPQLAEYQGRTEREIPVVVLDPQPGD